MLSTSWESGRGLRTARGARSRTQSMGFASLLSQITKDSRPGHSSSGPSRTAPRTAPPGPTGARTAPSKAKAAGSTRLPACVPGVQDDPAVARLKEARRQERERLQALRDAKNPRKARATRPKTPSSETPAQRRPASKAAATARSTPPKAQGVATPAAAKSRFKYRPLKHAQPPSSVAPQRTSEPAAPKLSFKDLMKKAESIEKPALLSLPFSGPAKSGAKEPSRAYTSLQKSRIRGMDTPRQPPTARNSRPKPSVPENRYSSSSAINRENTEPKAGVPEYNKPRLAQPNPSLLNKLKKKKQYVSTPSQRQQRYPLGRERKLQKPEKSDSFDIDAGDDDDEDEYGYGYGYEYEDGYDSQDDQFIVDDEDDAYSNGNDHSERKRKESVYGRMQSQGYSKDEIWEIFNRGKKRSYYNDDYDSDDMEATGTEILEDEERTLKQAKLDDLREQRELERRALEKKKLLRR